MEMSPRFLLILLLLVSSVPRYCFQEDSETSLAHHRSSQTSNEGSSYSLTIIASWLATIALFVACFYITFTSTHSSHPEQLAYTAAIAFTPAVHALDNHLRLIYHQDTSGILFTYFEAAREIFSAMPAASFMRIIDSLLKNYYSKTKNGDLDLTKVLLNKEFAIHYPFHVLQPTKYKATYIRLFLMRLFCYQGLVTTIFLYGLRVWYESTSGLSEFEGHCFQVIYLITSSASVSAVYAYSQGVDEEIPRYRMAHKIKTFELLMALLWFQGAGVDLLRSAHSYVILTTLVGFTVRDILDQN